VRAIMVGALSDDQKQGFYSVTSVIVTKPVSARKPPV